MFEDIPGIKHAFFTRQGGVSTGLYESLNCGPGSEDDPENVDKNRQIAMEKLGASAESLCTLYQCHSNEVVTLNDISEYDPSTNADGLVTNKAGITLGILTADCTPVLFADAQNKIIGAAHAGWKGALYGILENTVNAMFELGAANSDIVAAIGPAIGPDSYEIRAEFRDTFLNKDPDSHAFFKAVAKQDHYLFDLPGYVEHRLKKLGLKQVEWVGRDTLSDEDNFFSYRRNTLAGHKDYGRQLSAISLI